jgi:hypothetical protein
MYSIHRSRPSCAVMFDWPGCSGLRNVRVREKGKYREHPTHSFIPKIALTLVFSLSFALFTASSRFLW